MISHCLAASPLALVCSLTSHGCLVLLLAVCAPGYGVIAASATGNVTVDCQDLCPFGYYGDATGTSCGKCPDTVFNHPVGNALVSYGLTFYKGLTGPETCVPRYSQQANPSGHVMSLDDSMWNLQEDGVPRDDCLKTCSVEQCCIAQFEATDPLDEETGRCQTSFLTPVGPDTTTAKLYYKLPPSELIAAASKSNTTVKAKTQSSGIYARCSSSALEAAATDGKIGTSPFPDDIEKAKTFVRWNVAGCNSEASCEASCNALATCWGYIFVPGKGYALRGGEMQLGFRTVFISPQGGSAVPMANYLWGKPTAAVYNLA